MYAGKELTRDLQASTFRSAAGLRRVARYLVGAPSLVQKYNWQYTDDGDLTCTADADHASCRRSRKPTSGGLCTIGKHLLHFWCKTQATVALSSGESEFYSLTKCAAEGLYMQHLLKELVDTRTLSIFTDSTAAKGAAFRLGVGKKMKHIEVQDLVLQNIVQSKKCNLARCGVT